MNSERQLSCVISGSFDKAKPEIDQAIDTFTELGVKVLAPEKGWLYLPRSRRPLGFRPLPSEAEKTIKQIEDEFLQNLGNSDFLYLIDPNGYLGSSAALEVGYAVASKIPIYAQQELSLFLNDGITEDLLAMIKTLSPEEVIMELKVSKV